MLVQPIPHVTKREEQIIESAINPSSDSAAPVPKWLVLATLLLAPILWMLLFANLRTIELGVNTIGFTSFAEHLLPWVALVRQYQWQLATVALLVIGYFRERELSRYRNLIAKLYWRCRSTASQ